MAMTEKVSQRYIVDERELAFLERCEGTACAKDDRSRYDGLSADDLATLCLLKNRSNDMFFRRYQAACEVINLIAREVGIDPERTSFWLYTPEFDGSSPIVKRIEDCISRSGEKAQLKKRLQELEQENAVLRSLVTAR